MVRTAKGKKMDIDLISKIKETLQKKRLVYFSGNRMDYDPELIFFSHAEYDILARELYMAFCRKQYSKKDFLRKISKGIYRWLENYDLPKKISKAISKNVTNRLWKLPVQKLSPLSETEIRDIKIELRQKFRSHCCPELDCTDNASRRYFFRSPVVYVREINAYVLTNFRKYIHDEKKDEYRLDEAIEYEILDYCPFCGENLLNLRISDDRAIIEDAIKKWRDGAECKLDEGDSYITQVSFYGVNAYDSFGFISDVLAKKYSCFDDKYGVDDKGVLRKGGNFITVPKLFKLAQSCDWFKYCDTDPLEIDRENIQDYFSKKFEIKSAFSDDEILSLSSVLMEILWNMFHASETFDELLENKI